MSENITVKKSRKLQSVEDGVYIHTFLDKFGKEFLKEWDKKSSSSDFWRLGSHPPKVKPVPTKLTERSGKLVNALKFGSSDYIGRTEISGNTLTVTKGVKYGNIKYARRQEYQNSGSRSYLWTSLKSIVYNKLETIKKRAITLTNGAFK